MSNVLVLRKQDPVQATMGSQGFQPQINLTGGNNIPYNQYLPSWAGGSQYDPNAGYTGARPDITTTGEGDNASYGIGTNQYGTKEEAEAAHGAAPKYNLTTGQKIMGGTAAALPAAWSMLHSLSDDSQGDLFSAAGRGAMSGIAARSAANSAGLESGALSAGAKLDPALAHAGQMAASIDPRASQQAGVNATRGQVHRFKNQGFQTPKDFDASMFDGGYTNFADSTAGSTEDNVHQNNYEAETAKNAPLNALSPRQRTVNLLSEGVEESDKPSMIAGQKGVDAVQQAIDNQHVATGEHVMGESKRQLTLEEATRRATGKDTKQAMFKSRRPWSYY
jgi:hypothetical protein